MSQVHQSFTTDLNTKPFEQGLVRQENATRASTTRVVREFGRIDQANSRMARSMGGGRAASRAGQAALQMQEIGIQMQMGARASTIIAQQGSQIASVFGPTGMLVGGLVAAGALFWEAVRGSKALNKEAQERKRIEAQQAKVEAMQGAVKRVDEDQKATEALRLRAKLGEDGARAAEREAKYRREIRDLWADPRLSVETKSVVSEAMRDRFEAEVSAEQDKVNRGLREGSLRDAAGNIQARAAQIRGEAPSRRQAAREERLQRQAERRAVNEMVDKEDRRRRNTADGTNFGQTRGMTDEEKRSMREGGREALRAAKDDKVMARFSDEQLGKIVNAIEKLLTK